jgi:hypothetical protein
MAERDDILKTDSSGIKALIKQKFLKNRVSCLSLMQANCEKPE